jgi:hypothetical protein
MYSASSPRSTPTRRRSRTPAWSNTGYTAPGNDHGIVGDGTFYEIEVNGVTLVDWIEALLAGEPLDDVHCEDCETL